MIRLALVALGGGFGSVLRYVLAGWCQRFTGGAFPVGTLVVNVLGCLAIGVLKAAFSGSLLIREEYQIALTIGVLGGFTTFSTFGWETFAQVNEGAWIRAGLNVVLNVVLGFAAVLIGYRLAQKWFGA
ncbi:MAG TPA: fluoride efflux transporter CrcB [Phycisphaerae bacterium]|jgi:CrcB protein|nr:fluoride efflux transporter CrcB [Phycisphaerae bacterium]HOB73037.1 fluoride efflux transporter CrcB [Phycisphaerae bacterium]HOJ52914.1 fluoride efflux transporter CrcB [Phycisphaerae bacterium]HOL24650.1 fluoride efflux transporter CrcB [Phycisphaerae bacterium]HPP19187.1 fluoride efflux transporter CrcB [Phycisphaerae bacterium]